MNELVEKKELLDVLRDKRYMSNRYCWQLEKEITELEDEITELEKVKLSKAL